MQAPVKKNKDTQKIAPLADFFSLGLRAGLMNFQTSQKI
jgi:hypothetical protein